MWLSRKLTEQETGFSGESATVTIDGSHIAAVSRGEEREIPIVSPGGIAWLPRRGDEVLLLRGGTGGEERYLAGTVQNASPSLESGEIRLFSAGGASIVLKNDGSIELNGNVYVNGHRLTF